MTYIGKLQIPDDLLCKDKRKQGYFLRIAEYSGDAEEFISKCSAAAAASGTIITEKPANPDSPDINACVGIIGSSFTVSRTAIAGYLSSYLNSAAPLLGTIPENITAILEEIRKMGKNDSIIKNTFVKYMYWIKKYVSGLIRSAVSGDHPIVLLQGQMSKYELLFFSALADSGYDVIAVETDGDSYYASIDPDNKFSSLLNVPGGSAFPGNYSIGKKPNTAPALRPSSQPAVQPPVRIQRDSSLPEICTNAWLTGEIFTDICKPSDQRGSDPSVIYNCFVRINGVEDKNNYHNDIYQIYLGEKDKRNILVIDDPLELPSNEEIAKVRRGNYRDIQSLINDMSKNFVHASVVLQKMMCSAFAETIAGYYEENPDVRKALNEAVYLICWMKRYLNILFSGWKPGNISCVIVMNGCKTSREVYFIKMLAKLPSDVLILMPDLKGSCLLKDPQLYERNFVNSLTVEKFPRERANVQIGTVAFNAERDLDTIMYNDTGLYRSFQFNSANTIILKTMYEEIKILWDQELKYRPNFSSTSGSVNIPVIMAKISGVKDGKTEEYWNEISELINSDTIIIKNTGLAQPSSGYESAVSMIKNGRLQKDVIKKSRNYKYDFLKEETQNYILDKIQTLLDKNIIAGENGVQYRIITVGLNMSSDLLRRIQSFDFTKTNPKIIYINTTETIMSQDDSILFALLSQIGFDILLFIPTGYQSADKYYNPGTLVSHQIGEYVFDLRIPDLSKRSARGSLFGRLFTKK